MGRRKRPIVRHTFLLKALSIRKLKGQVRVLGKLAEHMLKYKIWGRREEEYSYNILIF